MDIQSSNHNPTPMQAPIAPNTPTDSMPPNPSSPPSISALNYDGTLGAIFKLWLLNTALFVITLGFYRFWGRTRVRQYLWSHLSLHGERFEYHGTGKELFLGFLVTLPIIIGYLALATIYPEIVTPLVMVIVILTWAAIYMGYRYRVKRTSWRGVRGDMEKKSMGYMGLCLLRTIINIFTLSLKKPKSDLMKWDYIVRHAHFGNVNASFNGNTEGLLKTHILTALLFFFTFGISRMWYQAALYNKKFSGLSIGNITFSTDVTGWSFFKFHFINGIIMSLTLFMGSAFVQHRKAAFFGKHLKVSGDLSEPAIANLKDGINIVGEGAIDAFGIDISFMS